MTAFVPTQLGVLLPSDINDLGAAGIADGEFAKRVGGAWAGAKAVENAMQQPYGDGIQIVSYRFHNLNSGDTQLNISIPAGYVGLCFGVSICSSGSSQYHIFSLRRDAVNYIANQGTASATTGGGTAINGLALQSGDDIVFNSTLAGANVGINIYLIPTSSSFKPLTQTLVNGSNTLYSVPSGKKTLLCALSSAAPTLQYAYPLVFNASGGTRNYSLYAVPQGGSPDNMTNRIGGNRAANNGTILSLWQVIPTILGENDSLVLTTDGAGNQIVYAIGMLEIA